MADNPVSIYLNSDAWYYYKIIINTQAHQAYYNNRKSKLITEINDAIKYVIMKVLRTKDYS